MQTFSQILSITSKIETRRAFRRHGGFKLLLKIIEDRLAWKSAAQGEDADFAQVKEVQRMEGVRLAFELLAWAQGDRDGEASFRVSLQAQQSVQDCLASS
jgi:hypothetical protein